MRSWHEERTVFDILGTNQCCVDVNNGWYLQKPKILSISSMGRCFSLLTTGNTLLSSAVGMTVCNVNKTDICHARVTGVLGGGAKTTAKFGGGGPVPVSTSSTAESKSPKSFDGAAAGTTRGGLRHNDVNFPRRE